MRTIRLPTSVDLYNVFVEDEDQLPRSSNEVPRGKQRPPHSLDLLHRVRLEIHVADAFVSRSLFTKTTSIPSIHSNWRHIEESTGFTESTVALSEDESVWLLFFVEPHHYCDLQDDTLSATDPFLRVSLETLVSLEHEIDTDVLPANAVIAKFAYHSGKGSTTRSRVPQALFDLLEERKLLKPHSISVPSLYLQSRFDDTVFDTLDSVVPNLAQARLESLSEISTTSNGVNGRPCGDSQTLKNKDAYSINGSYSINGVGSKSASPKKLENEDAHADAVLSQILEENKFLCDLQRVEANYLQEDIEHLDSLVNVKQNAVCMVDQLAKNIDVTRNQTLQVQESLREVRIECSLMEFLLDSQQIRLVRNLAELFPISSDVNTECFTIRGMRIPNISHVSWLSVLTEDELSTALGHTVQVVLCLSNYMGVELRHGLQFGSSRSSIQEASSNVIYPLFCLNRQDRDKLLFGLELLHANMNQLVDALHISMSSKAPILEKLQRVYHTIIDGY